VMSVGPHNFCPGRRGGWGISSLFSFYFSNDSHSAVSGVADSFPIKKVVEIGTDDGVNY